MRIIAADAGPLVRRAIDILGAACGLALLLPILLFAALAIKLTSRGPVLFWQERIGHHGRSFLMPKLRTMVVNADKMKDQLAARMPEALDEVRFKLKQDPRITPVGRFLRRYSVDEMPQLWIVLKGDMTIVGPRPPLPREVALYDARAARRLEVKPGLTCLWQINGRSDLSFEQQVHLDIEYIDRIQTTQELSIFIRTLPAVVLGRGAY